MKKSALIFMLILSLFLSACGKREESRDSVSIWCLEDEALLPELRNEIEKYNKNIKGDYLPVSIRTFPDFKSLSEGFNALRPDLIICTQAKAEELNSLGLCRDIGSLFIGREIEFPDYIIRRSPQTGRSYFPIGGDIPLLCGKEEQNFKDFKTLCKAAEEYGEKEGLPFLSLQRLPELFYYEMLSAGKEFHGVQELDIKSPLYKEIYNSIANGVFTGGLNIADEGSAQLIKEGHLAFAGVFGSSLQGMDLSEFKISLMPSMKPDNSLYARSSGLAVCIRDGREQKSTAQFLSWLFSEERAKELSLKSGLVPLVSLGEFEGTNQFENLLLSVSREKELHLPEFDRDFIKNQENFEAEFKAQISCIMP